MTTETPPLTLPIQARPTHLPMVIEMNAQRRHTIAVLSNWQEQTSPVHCMWFCPHEEVLQKKPIVAFPAVEQCLLLVGSQENTDFFGHFSPLTAGVTGSALDQVMKEIDEEAPISPSDEHNHSKKVTIYTVSENSLPDNTPLPIAVGDFKKRFEAVGYEVKLHTLPHELFGKTLLWDTEKAAFERSDDTYEVTLPTPLGRYSSQKIYTEDG